MFYKKLLTSTELNVFYGDMVISIYFLICSYLCSLQLIYILHSVCAYTDIVINGGYCSLQPQKLQCTWNIYTFMMKTTQYQLKSKLPQIHKEDTHSNALRALKEMCHQNVNMFSLKKKKILSGNWFTQDLELTFQFPN